MTQQNPRSGRDNGALIGYLISVAIGLIAWMATNQIVWFHIGWTIGGLILAAIGASIGGGGSGGGGRRTQYDGLPRGKANTYRDGGNGYGRGGQ